MARETEVEGGKLVLRIGMGGETCCTCGVLFGMTADYQQRLRETGALFHCPNGHPQHYADSLADRLKAAERTAAKAARNADAWAGQARRDEAARKVAERSLAATRGQVTRLRTRAQAGLCPCCNRSFQDLRRHMASKHPDARVDGEA